MHTKHINHKPIRYSNGDKVCSQEKKATLSDFYNYELVDDVNFSKNFGNCLNDNISLNKPKDLNEETRVSPKILLKDYGPNPLVINIEEATEENTVFRRALWTGKYLQVTLMSIQVGEEVGLELHNNTDQFIRVEEGRGIIKIGKSKENLDFSANIRSDIAAIIPAGMWHNIINTGNKPLKLYSIYAPPHHEKGTVHVIKKDAEEDKVHS